MKSPALEPGPGPTSLKPSAPSTAVCRLLASSERIALSVKNSMPQLLLSAEAPEVNRLLNGVTGATLKGRMRALATISVAAKNAVTIAADRSLTLNDSAGPDLMGVRFEDMINDQGVAP